MNKLRLNLYDIWEVLSAEVRHVFSDSTVLLIFGAQCVGTLICCCLNEPALAMSVSTLYSAMSFSLSGFSYPIESMPGVFQSFCWLYPIRHYFLNFSNIAIFGNGMGHCWPQFCALLAFGFLLIGGAFMLRWHYRLEERKAAQTAPTPNNVKN